MGLFHTLNCYLFGKTDTQKWIENKLKEMENKVKQDALSKDTKSGGFGGWRMNKGLLSISGLSSFFLLLLIAWLFG